MKTFKTINLEVESAEDAAYHEARWLKVSSTDGGLQLEQAHGDNWMVVPWCMVKELSLFACTQYLRLLDGGELRKEFKDNPHEWTIAEAAICQLADIIRARKSA